MSEFSDGELAYVDFHPIETIVTPNGEFAIWQANAKRIEHIEAACVTLYEDRGVVLRDPFSKSSPVRPFFPVKAIEYEGQDNYPVVVFLSGPKSFEKTNSS